MPRDAAGNALRPAVLELVLYDDFDTAARAAQANSTSTIEEWVRIHARRGPRRESRLQDHHRVPSSAIRCGGRSRTCSTTRPTIAGR